MKSTSIPVWSVIEKQWPKLATDLIVDPKFVIDQSFQGKSLPNPINGIA